MRQLFGFGIGVTLGFTPKSEASMHRCDALNLAVRLKAFLAQKHFARKYLGFYSQIRRGRPFSANSFGKEAAPAAWFAWILWRLPAFRHGFATALVDQGASITTVGAQLRHSDPRSRLNCMPHVVPQSQRDAVRPRERTRFRPIADSAIQLLTRVRKVFRF